jgi:hypothetical protein
MVVQELHVIAQVQQGIHCTNLPLLAAQELFLVRKKREKKNIMMLPLPDSSRHPFQQVKKVQVTYPTPIVALAALSSILRLGVANINSSFVITPGFFFIARSCVCYPYWFVMGIKNRSSSVIWMHRFMFCDEDCSGAVWV